MTYMVVCKQFIPDLEDRVNELIKHGWEPMGGVSTTYFNSFIQAMVFKD